MRGQGAHLRVIDGGGEQPPPLMGEELVKTAFAVAFGFITQHAVATDPDLQMIAAVADQLRALAG